MGYNYKRDGYEDYNKDNYFGNRKRNNRREEPRATDSQTRSVQPRNRRPKKEWEPEDIVGYEGDGLGGKCAVSYEEIKHVTEKGALLVIDGVEEWVPRSQIIFACEDYFEATMWWANKAGYA